MYSQRSILLFLFYLSSMPISYAFDNDYTIVRPNFALENFLDINSTEYSDELEDKWRTAHNGMRITGHSLAADLLYVKSDIKISSEIGDKFNFYFNVNNEVFYADKPPQEAKIELEFVPTGKAVGYSVITTPHFNKSESDIGVAVTLGDRFDQFIRLEAIRIDPLFNQKNSPITIDYASYTRFQDVINLSLYKNLTSKLSLLAAYEDASLLQYDFDDTITHFTHSGRSLNGYLNYRLSSEDSVRLLFRRFDENKSITNPLSDQEQDLNYKSINLRWNTHSVLDSLMTFGFRYDVMTNRIIDSIDSYYDEDYFFKSRQIYATYEYPYRALRAWNFGLYIARMNEPFDKNIIPQDRNANAYQEQFRASWVAYSHNKNANFQFHLSLNIDEFESNPGDGAGMTFQSVF